MKSFILALLGVALLAPAEVTAMSLQKADKTMSNYALVEKVNRKKKKGKKKRDDDEEEDEFDPAILGLIGGLLGGVGNIAGGIVGGETGKTISNSANLVSGISAGAATEDYGAMVGAAANGASAFIPSSSVSNMVGGIGNNIGGGINAFVDGDAAAGLNALGSAGAFSPLAGDQISGGFGTFGGVVGAVDAGGDNMAANLVGQIGGGAGGMIGGVPGTYINNLTPVAMDSTNQITQGQYGSALNTGLLGIGGQMGNTIGGTIFNTAGLSAGAAVDAAVSGNTNQAWANGLGTITNTGNALNGYLNP